jgi:hypothetical protein
LLDGEIYHLYVNSVIVSISHQEFAGRSRGGEQAERAAESPSPNGARGALTGVLLGASFWGAILVLASYIKP